MVPNLQATSVSVPEVHTRTYYMLALVYAWYQVLVGFSAARRWEFLSVPPRASREKDIGLFLRTRGPPTHVQLRTTHAYRTDHSVWLYIIWATRRRYEYDFPRNVLPSIKGVVVRTV